MFNGTTIEDLIKVVERTEGRARAYTVDRAGFLTPRMEVYPAYSTYVYQWPPLEQAIGAA